MKSIKLFAMCILLYSNNFLAVKETITYDVPRPMTAEEIAAYKKAHPGYTIHAETYKETTAPHTVITGITKPHAPWTESADKQAQKKWSEREKNLERAMQEKRILNKQQDTAARKIQTKWRKKHAKIVPTIKPIPTINPRHKLEGALTRYDVEKAKEAISEGAVVMSGDLIKYPDFTAKSPEMVQLLLDHGANADATDSYGRTPLFFMYKQPETVKIILNAGANVHRKDLIGWTPLNYFGRLYLPNPEDRMQLHNSMKELMRHGAIVPDDLKTNPVIKKLAREVRDEKIAAIRSKADLQSRFRDLPSDIIKQYAGE